jgi:DNA ligase-1
MDGETTEVKGSAKDPYILKNTGGVYSCTCPAWRNQSVAIESRTCKHLRQYLGEEFEKQRLGGEIPARSGRAPGSSTTRKQQAMDGAEGTAEDASTPGLLLAHSWDGTHDLTGWWMSEKLDGVRAYWDGSKFISRQGNVYHAPDWFIENLPSDVHLDGELWLDRKGFQRAVSIVRRQDKNNDWKDITFVVFDAPLLEDPFEARMAFIQTTLDEIGSKYALAHQHVRCNSIDHLREELRRVEAIGGEGLMLRQPSSKYEVGRSFTLLKVKTFHDAEATVIEILPGTGKHKGRMGALQVELADGTRFSVGTGFADAQRENPPELGSTITFRYQELSDRGVPRFPSFVRVRTDADQLPSAKLSAAAPGVKVASGNDTRDETERAERSSEARGALHSDPEFNNKTSSLNEGSWREFQFVEGTSSKFWKISCSGNEVIVCFGKIGTQGQAKPKSFSTPAEAKAHMEKLIAEKTGKGYLEVFN